jgi:phage regulator Rha-like protein
MPKQATKSRESKPIPKSEISNPQSEITVPEEVILGKIYMIRGQKVMLDMDLAELYDVETKHLKRAVKRNITRFPEDFMFELTSEELINWRYHFGTSNREKMGIRIKPFAFTEHGILMLASVLHSERAIQMNIRIVRIFNQMREMLHAQKEILAKLMQVEKNIEEHDEKILLIFDYLNQLEQAKQEEQEFFKRRRIGFKNDGD